MLLKLYFIRKIKGLFIRFRLHLLVNPFFSFFLNLIYLGRLSRWCRENMKLPFNDFYNGSVKYQDRIQLHEYVYKNHISDKAIDYFEFGVAEGLSFGWWLKWNSNPDSRFYGFDTFTGLPEDFGVMKKPDYDTGGNFPKVNDTRASFVPGLFQDSLEKFLPSYQSDRRKVIHMDADLYSSTLYVLTRLYPLLNNNDVIIFDEFGVPTHEFRAFTDFVHAYNFKYEILGAKNNFLQLAIVVKK